MSKKNQKQGRFQSKGLGLGVWLTIIGIIVAALAALGSGLLSNSSMIHPLGPVVLPPTRIPFDASYHPVADPDLNMAAAFNVTIVGEVKDWPGNLVSFPRSVDNWILYIYHHFVAVDINGDGVADEQDKQMTCTIVVAPPGDGEMPVITNVDYPGTILSGRAWGVLGSEGNIYEFALNIENSMREDPRCGVVGFVGFGIGRYFPR